MTPGQMNSTYVSAINFMKQREIMNKVVDLFNEEETIVDIMDLCDRYVPTAVKEYVYHANTRLHAAATVAVAGAAQPAAGATSVVPLTSGSVKPIVGSMMLTAGRHRSVVTAVSGDNVTVKPLSGSTIAHAALASLDKVTFFSNAYAEGTGANIGYKWPTIQYENNIQIIKQKYSVTDIAAFEKVEVEFEGEPYYYIKGVNDVFGRFKMDIAYAILLGEKGSFTDASGATVYTTQGLEKATRGSGTNLALRVDTTANFRTDFRSFNRAFDQARGPLEYWALCGPDMGNYFDDWLTELEGVKAGGVVYNSFNGMDGKKRAIQLGFDSFRIYDRTFHKKKMAALDNPQITAATSFTYPSTVFFIPGDKVKTQYDAEKKDRFRIRYFEAPAAKGLTVNRTDQYHEVLTGGLAPTPTSDVMELNTTFTTWQGTEFVGLEHFGINTF